MKSEQTPMTKRLILALLLLSFSACDSINSDVLDLALDDPDRKTIDVSKMGINNFFVHSNFGSIEEQFLEIRDVLKIKHVRVLFAWTEGVQPSPSADRFYGFYDSIVDAVPDGVDIIPVLVHTPGWMIDPANWGHDNARTAFVEEWIRPTVARYAGHPRISGWEIWNEQDFIFRDSDSVLELTEPANYIDLLAKAHSVIKSLDSSKLIILGATRSIQQNFPDTLNYNKQMRDLGALDYVDIWNVHFYGKQYERVVQDDGVEDFLEGLPKLIWITESGQTGPNQQLAYVEQAWPFLRKEIPNIDRIYYYEYGNTTPGDSNYGLKSVDPNFPVSDLYVHLRDR